MSYKKKNTKNVNVGGIKKQMGRDKRFFLSSYKHITEFVLLWFIKKDISEKTRNTHREREILGSKFCR